MSIARQTILLIYPPSRTQVHYSCPLGIQYVASVLEKAGHRVILLDANAARNRRGIDQIARIVLDTRPDVVGMTLVTPIVYDAYQLASLLRQEGIPLLAGGPHATILPEETIRHGFDAAVAGEGEPVVAEAVEALLGYRPKDGVAGWVYRDGKGIPRWTTPRPMVEDLDSLPPPARHLVSPLDYGPDANPLLHTNLLSSRGCPAKCAYCSGGLFGNKFRFRSAENVLREIFDLKLRYGTRHFHFADDAMSMDTNRLREICEGLSQRGPGLTWTMMTRVDRIDEDLLRRASVAGCIGIDYGIESGHPETLRKIHKPHTAQMVRRVVSMTARFGIQPSVFFIFGFPWEGPEEIDVTISLMKELAPHVYFHPAVGSILTPYPKTEIYDRYKDEYDFKDWWLKEERLIKSPRPSTHSYFERQFFPIGAILDADFFRYPPKIRKKIHESFRFMYLQNIRKSAFHIRTIKPALLHFSESLYALSPRLEKFLFGGIESVACLIRRNSGASPSP